MLFVQDKPADSDEPKKLKTDERQREKSERRDDDGLSKIPYWDLD